MAAEIDKNTKIYPGMALSKNIILGHMSNGAYSYLLGRWLPQYTSFLKPGSSTLPLWNVAKNLSLGADGLVENLIDGFGQDLILRSGFIGNVSSLSNLGKSFDIQIDGYQNNMYAVSEEIQKLTKTAKNVQMVFGNTSFMRINYDESSIMNNLANGNLPSFSTIDTINNVVEEGLTSIRGLV